MKKVKIDGVEYKLVPVEEEVECGYPKRGTEYFYVNGGGTIGKNIWQGSGGEKRTFNVKNLYLSEHDAKMGALRDEAYRKPEFYEWLTYLQDSKIGQGTISDNLKGWVEKYSDSISYFDKK